MDAPIPQQPIAAQQTSPLGGSLDFSPEEAIRFGWQATKANLWFLIGVAVVIGGVGLVSSALKETFGKDAPALSSLVQLIIFIIQIIVSVGIVKISLVFADKQKPEFSQLFPTDIALLAKFFASTVIYSVLIGLGFLLFIIPGFYFMLKYQFYQYFVVDKNAGPIQAGKMSAQITKGIKMKLFLFWAMLMGLNILGMLALGVGLFVTMSISTIATAHVYRTLSSHAS